MCVRGLQFFLERLGAQVSSLQLLGQANFKVSSSALPDDGSPGRLRLFATDQAALAAAKVVVDALENNGVAVSPLHREGRGSFWFRCDMGNQDVAISVMISERHIDSVSVHIVACRLPKVRHREIECRADANWPAVAEIIRLGIVEHFQQFQKFEWLGEPFQEPEHQCPA